MKKAALFIVIVLVLSGCGNSAAEAEKLEVAESRAEAAEKQVAQLEKQISDLTDKLDAAETLARETELELFSLTSAGFSDPVRHNQNVVVKDPQKNRVTFEIDERLVGKYIVEDDPEMYFEIKPDGKAEISLNVLIGYAFWNPELIQLTAYYSDRRVFINFNLVSGKWTFPTTCGLSLTFLDENNNFDSFRAISYWPDHSLNFVKQN